ncbi:MAG: rod shape-determining protein RodA [Trueperaceae bacterium]|nr:rod shape-determining protein RodA [Trueperaceae bacterium]
MVRSDPSLPVLVLLLLGGGLLTLSSAAPGGEFMRQLTFLGVSAMIVAVVLWVGKRRILRLVPHLYVLSLTLLVAVQAFGTRVNGAKSWLYVGPLPGFQPSELAKIALILALAMALHDRPIRGLRGYLAPLALMLPPFALVLIEPDLGGALVIAAIGAAMLLMRGLPWRHLAAFALVFAVAVPTVVWPNLAPHQRERMVSFMHPGEDPLGSGYQVIQSTIAIGSGGLTGKGWGQGTQSQLGFIPYRQTDFIFSVLAEEGGFVAAATLLVLYGLLFWRLVSMAGECPFERDQFVILGVLTLIGVQVLINVGVALGMAPVTGLTLPLVSYGGSSLVTTLTALALAFVVHRDRYAHA